jgi:hypothetical protein
MARIDLRQIEAALLLSIETSSYLSSDSTSRLWLTLRL